MTRRLFAGIALDDETRAACAAAAQRLQGTGYAARYEDPAKLHATLAFLGNVETERYDAIVEALRVAAGGTAFELVLDKVAAFPHERKPRVVYVGARDQGAAFRALASEVREAFVRLGFEFKEDSVAHVTIARVKEPHRPLPLVELAPIRMQVDRVGLFESLYDRGARTTTRYEVLETCALGSLSHSR